MSCVTVWLREIEPLVSNDHSTLSWISHMQLGQLFLQNKNLLFIQHSSELHQIINKDFLY